MAPIGSTVATNSLLSQKSRPKTGIIQVHLGDAEVTWILLFLSYLEHCSLMESLFLVLKEFQILGSQDVQLCEPKFHVFGQRKFTEYEFLLGL